MSHSFKISFVALFIFLSGVTAAFADQKPDPVVFVPGIMGSWNWDVLQNTINPPIDLTGWTFPPFTHTYDTLVQALKDGAGEDRVFIAFYDWRMPARNAVKHYLKPVIDKAKALSLTGKVDIVAHSMGGNVARAYIEDPDIYENDVDQLITIGTPNYGSSDSYLAWEGGNIDNYKGIMWYALNAYLFIIESNAKDFDSRKAITTVIPSVKELLPTYDFIHPINAANLTPANQMAEQNPLLPDLNSDANLRRLLFRARVTNIAGTNVATNKIIFTDVPSTAELKDGLWVDGKPIALPPLKDTVNGDGTVLLESAFLPTPPREDFGPPPLFLMAPWQRFIAWFLPPARAQLEPPFFPPPYGLGPPVPDAAHIILNACHACLPNQAIGKVFTTLGMTIKGDLPQPFIDPNTLLAYYFASPVSVQITDPQGRVISKTSNTIPGAEYSDNGQLDGPRLVFIPNPPAGVYTITLFGTASGQFHMASTYFPASGPFEQQRAQGAVTSGQVITYTQTVSAVGSPGALIVQVTDQPAPPAVPTSNPPVVLIYPAASVGPSPPSSGGGSAPAPPAAGPFALSTEPPAPEPPALPPTAPPMPPPAEPPAQLPVAPPILIGAGMMTDPIRFANETIAAIPAPPPAAMSAALADTSKAAQSAVALRSDNPSLLAAVEAPALLLTVAATTAPGPPPINWPALGWATLEAGTIVGFLNGVARFFSRYGRRLLTTRS